MQSTNNNKKIAKHTNRTIFTATLALAISLTLRVSFLKLLMNQFNNASFLWEIERNADINVMQMNQFPLVFISISREFSWKH